MRKTLSSSLLAAVSASSFNLPSSLVPFTFPRGSAWGRPNRYFNPNSPKLLAKRKECKEYNDYLKRLKQLTPYLVSRKGRIL